MNSAKKFFDWAYDTRAETVIKINGGEMMSPDKMFLSFCSHEPTFISNGPAGLNGSVKGVGFLPKDEYLEEILEIYLKHIETYEPGDKTYSKRGLQILVDQLYLPEVKHRIDFTKVASLELAKRQSWENYQVNPEACLLYFQPPAISFKLKGQMEIYDEQISGKREIYQQFVNAQHDMYHNPNGTDKWKNKPAYIFRIEEVYDNGVSKDGFGQKLEYPCPEDK